MSKNAYFLEKRL